MSWSGSSTRAREEKRGKKREGEGRKKAEGRERGERLFGPKWSYLVRLRTDPLRPLGLRSYMPQKEGKRERTRQ